MIDERMKNYTLEFLFIRRHGTRCAGEVGKLDRKDFDFFSNNHSIFIAAAANNNICNVGVAYNARIGGKLLTAFLVFLLSTVL
jgi:hypothetical protein